MKTKLTEASGFKDMQDALRGGGTNVNLGNKNANAGQNSLVHPALSTAGDVAVNGEIVTVTASSTFFTLPQKDLAAFQGVAYALTINNSGAGAGLATNILTSAQISESHSALLSGGLTSAQISTLGGPGYDIVKSTDIEWPAVPATQAGVAIYAVGGADSAHSAGSHTFSHATSDGGTHKYFQRVNMNINS